MPFVLGLAPTRRAMSQFSKATLSSVVAIIFSTKVKEESYNSIATPLRTSAIGGISARHNIIG